jgi:hypothetical protein
MRVPLAENGKGGAGVLGFATSVVMFTFAEVDTAKVEAQHGGAGAAETAGEAVGHLVVHRAPVERVWVADEGRLRGFAGLRLLDEGFEASGGTRNHERFDAARHQFER